MLYREIGSMSRFHMLRILLRILTALLMIFVTYMSFLPALHVSTPFRFMPYEDKMLHAGAYFLMSFLLFLSLAHRPRHTALRTLFRENCSGVAASFSLTVILGIVIEILQPLTGRSMELLDAVADASGAGAGIAVALLVLEIYARRYPHHAEQ